MVFFSSYWQILLSDLNFSCCRYCSWDSFPNTSAAGYEHLTHTKFLEFHTTHTQGSKCSITMQATPVACHVLQCGSMYNTMKRKNILPLQTALTPLMLTAYGLSATQEFSTSREASAISQTQKNMKATPYVTWSLSWQSCSWPPDSTHCTLTESN